MLIFHVEMKMNKTVIFTFGILQYFGVTICCEDIIAR